MKKEMLVEELQARGFNAELTETVKNGVVYTGIIIKNNTKIAPIIYIDGLLMEANYRFYTISDMVDKIIEIYKENKADDFDYKPFFTTEYILENVVIGLQKSSTEDILKKDSMLDGIEAYLYISGKMNDGNVFTVKMTKSLIASLGITEASLWDKALTNTCKNATLKSMSQVLSELSGLPYDESQDSIYPMYVLSNQSRIKGAAAIYNKSFLKTLAEKFGVNKLIVLPSSIHELIIVPFKENTDMDYLTNMVTDINDTQVDPIDQLTNRAYVLAV